MNMTSWDKRLKLAMSEHGEKWEDVEDYAPKKLKWMHQKFDSGYGGENGCVQHIGGG